jgi:hypothetical protein
MLLDFECRSHPVDGLGQERLWDCVNSLVNLNLRSRKGLELSGVKQKWESGHFFKEALQVESSLIDELQALRSHHLLGRQLRNRDTRPT